MGLATACTKEAMSQLMEAICAHAIVAAESWCPAGLADTNIDGMTFGRPTEEEDFLEPSASQEKGFYMQQRCQSWQ